MKKQLSFKSAALAVGANVLAASAAYAYSCDHVTANGVYKKNEYTGSTTYKDTALYRDYVSNLLADFPELESDYENLGSGFSDLKERSDTRVFWVVNGEHGNRIQTITMFLYEPAEDFEDSDEIKANEDGMVTIAQSTHVKKIPYGNAAKFIVPWEGDDWELNLIIDWHNPAHGHFFMDVFDGTDDAGIKVETSYDYKTVSLLSCS